ncbi:phenylacetate--CoA ligase family protein [Gangjinia marincola]|uniref:Phenylacetate--CoA ligase family protein n=1 Tax=Gangjinia marincola TaxID=578463 RepID=A0ABN1MIB9_9FLAO
MNLFDLSLRLNGFPILEAKKKLAEIQKIPEADYANYITQKKLEIVTFHQRHNSFYREISKGILPQNWEQLPILTKSDLQQPLEARLSDGFNPKNIYVNKTSGSSGHPFVFAKDKFCHALTWARINALYNQHGITNGVDKEARFYGIPKAGVARKKERFKDLMANRYRFSIFDLGVERLEKILIKFEKEPFVSINGYTSSVVLFGRYLDSKNIILKDYCPSLKACIVTAEMLFPEDKTMLTKVLGVPVVNEYGASEVGIMAFTNPLDEFEIDTSTLHLEVLDDHNIPVRYGEEGNIVVTSLFNKAHPIIRYKIGDRGIISPDSSAKKTILSDVKGRVDDIIKLPSGKVAAGLTCYYITKKVVDINKALKEFVITQTHLDRFIVSYVSDQNLTPEEKNLIEKSFEEYLEGGLKITYEREEVLDRSNRGKLKQFKSLI